MGIRKRRMAIFMVLSITAFFIIVILLNGIKYEFTEENFLPENRVIKANAELYEKFENYYGVVAIVKAKNVLEKDVLLSILFMEKEANESLNAVAYSIADVVAVAFLINENKEVNYDNMIKVMENKSNDDITSLLNFLGKIMPEKPWKIFLSNDFDGKEADSTIVQFLLNETLFSNKKEALKAERKIEEIARRNEGKEKIRVIGGEVITEEIMKSNRKSISILLPLSFALVILALFIAYRNVFEIFVSISILFISIIWVYGFASLIHFHLNPISASIPVLLVGIGIDYSIHLTMRIKENKPLKAVISALFLSTITTAIGFLSNSFSSISLLQQFGILSAFGIVSCFAITLLMIPSIDEFKKFARIEKRKFSEFLPFLAGIVKRHKKKSMAVIISVTIFLLIFSFKLKTEYDVKDFLPENAEISKAIEYFISNFNYSTGEIDVIIKGNVTSKSFLMNLKNSTGKIKEEEYVVEVESILSYMQDYAENNAIFDLHFNETFSRMYNETMGRKNISSREIERLYDWIYIHGGRYFLSRNEKYDEVVIRIKVNPHGSRSAIKKLHDEIAWDIEDIEGIKVITGGTMVGYVVMNELQKSQSQSLLLALLLSFIIMEIVFGRKRRYFLAFISILPVIFATIWILGTMAILGISLTITTITVAAISIGLGVDYSIHITNEYLYTKNAMAAVRNSGGAILFSALTTISAFALLSLSPLPPIKTFAILISISIFYIFMATVFILPALLDRRK